MSRIGGKIGVKEAVLNTNGVLSLPLRKSFPHLCSKFKMIDRPVMAFYIIEQLYYSIEQETRHVDPSWTKKDSGSILKRPL